jgi:hypothetical protein
MTQVPKTLSGLVERNRSFLSALYRGDRPSRPAFICLPVLLDVFEGLGDYTLSEEPVERWLPRTVENYTRQVRMLEALGDDAVPCAPLGTGTHIYAAAFGCRVHTYPDNNPAAVPMLRTAAEADALATPDIWKSPTLYRVFEMAEATRKELGKDIPPGCPDAQSGFDTACLVWKKEDLFCAMMDPREKESVNRLTQKCSDLLKTFHQELVRQFPTINPCHCPPVWTPPGHGPQVSNDECGSMSVAAFEEFCLPELIDLSETFGDISMHCCADAEHQFPSFRKIPNFYAFNRVAAKRGYLPLLEHFSGPEAPVHVLAWIAEDQIASLLRQAATGSRFIFVRMGTESPADGRAWLDKMHALARP